MDDELTSRLQYVETQLSALENDMPDRRDLSEFVAGATSCIGELAGALDDAGRILSDEFVERFARLRNLAARLA